MEKEGVVGVESLPLVSLQREGLSDGTVNSLKIKYNITL
jgi:hypothetical protein